MLRRSNSLTKSSGDILSMDLISVQKYQNRGTYHEAMREDLSEWLNELHNVSIHAISFFNNLEDGSLLCIHANLMTTHIKNWLIQNESLVIGMLNKVDIKIPNSQITYRKNVQAKSFFARDNIAKFLNWCKNLGLPNSVMFETEDLVMRKNEHNVIVTLLELGRIGARYGMIAPKIIELEQEIEKEKAEKVDTENFNIADMKPMSRLSDSLETDTDTVLNNSEIESVKSQLTLSQDNLYLPKSPKPEEYVDSSLNTTISQVSNNEEVKNVKVKKDKPKPKQKKPVRRILKLEDLTLNELVRRALSKCTCPSIFPVYEVSEGRYLIGDESTPIFVRSLRNHLMVRIGGGWATFEDYLNRHDPCRCDNGHTTNKRNAQFAKRKQKNKKSIQEPEQIIDTQAIETLKKDASLNKKKTTKQVLIIGRSENGKHKIVDDNRVFEKPEEIVPIEKNIVRRVSSMRKSTNSNLPVSVKSKRNSLIAKSASMKFNKSEYSTSTLPRKNANDDILRSPHTKPKIITKAISMTISKPPTNPSNPIKTNLKLKSLSKETLVAPPKKFTFTSLFSKRKSSASMKIKPTTEKEIFTKAMCEPIKINRKPSFVDAFSNKLKVKKDEKIVEKSSYRPMDSNNIIQRRSIKNQDKTKRRSFIPIPQPSKK
ncbi:hypothetical protein A3Q56_00898 [Intoshia linei]|uniref:GAS2-like protein 1 n=1 Tax=Intoshia linei TaxID=1819745 RepID=A0A177BAW0_9BILA|nr:hypothetical protein A3Q56_00898 [Intoshia linei]